MRTDRGAINAARQKYRLAAGVERALATIGYKATVADALKCAGMSRRTFYEHFTSMEDVIVRMQRAMPAMVALYQVERPGDEPESKEPRDADRAYRLVLCDWPHAEPMLLVMGTPLRGHPYRFTADAIEGWRAEWSESVPRNGASMPERFLFAWVDAMAGRESAESEAAQ